MLYSFKTEKEALAKQLEVRTQIAQGTIAMGPDQTVKQFLEHWFEDVYKLSGVRLRTIINTDVVIRRHLIPGLGHIKLQKLTVQAIQAFYSKKMKAGTSASRIKRFHITLSMALEYARRSRLIVVNVCKDVQLPKQQESDHQALTPEQAKLLIEKIQGHKLEALLTLAIATGMREGEILGLRWSDVDFHNECLQVNRTLLYLAGHGFVESEPKTAKSRRKIVLPHFVVEVLTRHHVGQLKKRFELGKDWNSRNLVFPDKDGDFLRYVKLLRHFRKLLDEIGLPCLRFHDLRHSAATLLLSMGVSMKVVQELLGHSNIHITMDVYSHVLPSMQREAADKMNTFFDSGAS